MLTMRTAKWSGLSAERKPAPEGQGWSGWLKARRSPRSIQTNLVIPAANQPARRLF